MSNMSNIFEYRIRRLFDLKKGIEYRIRLFIRARSGVEYRIRYLIRSNISADVEYSLHP